MPLALLLAEPLAALRRGIAGDVTQRGWRRWEALAITETLVLNRARNAYLTHWFGTVPLDGLAVKVSVDNLGEIQQRLGDLRGRRSETEKASLLEPLLGATGGLAGALAVPINSMLTGIVAHVALGTWWATLGAALNWITFGVLGAAALTIGAPVGALVIGGMLALPDGKSARNVFEHLATIGLQLRELYEQLTSGNVKNPLLRALLELGDLLAGLAVQLAGSLLWFLSRVVPRLGPLSTAAVAFVALAKELAGAFKRIMDDVKVGLPKLVDRRDGPLVSVVVVFRTLGTVMSDIGRSVGQIPPMLRAGVAPFRDGVKQWWKDFDPKVVITKHPLVIALTELTPSITLFAKHAKQLVAGILRRIPVVGNTLGNLITEESGAFSKKLKQMALDKVLAMFPPPPPLPPFPTTPSLSLPKVSDLPAPYTPADPATSSKAGPEIAQAYQALAKARDAQPVDVFAAEAARLRAERDRARANTAELAAYLRIARHAVAPAAAEGVRALEDVLRNLDRETHAGAKRVFPVKDLVPTQALRPRVKRLVVTAEAKHEAPVRRYVRSMTRALNAQVFELELVR